MPIALAFLLVASLAFQVLAPPPPTVGGLSVSPARSLSPVSHIAVAGAVLPGVDAAAIVARSIFSPSRGSGDAPAAAADVQLLGVARSGGGVLATLGDRAGATATLHPGESWQGWTLTAVGQGVAVLRREGAVLTLRLGQPLAAAPAGTP